MTELAERLERKYRFFERFSPDTEHETMILLREAATALRATPEPEWEYEARPYTADPEEPEWSGRPVADAQQLVTEHANPDHWINKDYNADLAPVVGYRTYRRVKAGEWEPVS